LIEFGKLLNQAWKAKKKLSSTISNNLIDEIYSLALKNGAVGGKLIGAGGGGFFLFYVEKDKAEFRKKMSKFVEIPFLFEGEGSKILYIG
jgi:D-glycero-alpha-D-manno-heptose-7-phosphate kinase